MKTVWKFGIETTDVVINLSLPRGAKIIEVAGQNNSPTFWAVVDPAAELVKREFCLVGTGMSLPEGNFMYLGTCHLFLGTLVLHLFEKVPSTQRAWDDEGNLVIQ